MLHTAIHAMSGRGGKTLASQIADAVSELGVMEEQDDSLRAEKKRADIELDDSVDAQIAQNQKIKRLLQQYIQAGNSCTDDQTKMLQVATRNVYFLKREKADLLQKRPGWSRKAALP